MFTKQALKNKSVLGETIKACATVLIAKIRGGFLFAPFPQLAALPRGALQRGTQRARCWRAMALPACNVRAGWVSGLSYKQDVNRRERVNGVRDGAGVQTWPGGAGVTELKETGVGGNGVEREACARRRLKRVLFEAKGCTHLIANIMHIKQRLPRSESTGGGARCCWRDDTAGRRNTRG